MGSGGRGPLVGLGVGILSNEFILVAVKITR